MTIRKIHLILALACACGLGLRAQAPQLLRPGAQAPEISAEAYGGGTLNLSSQLGKVVVLDFWATWCPPCQKSMPHLQSVAKAVAGQNVAVLGVCVWDQRGAYDRWMEQHKGQLDAITFGYDPAGKSRDNLAARFNVSGIPTTYVLNRDGKVAEAIVGYDNGDARLESALRKLGIRIH